MVFCVLGNTWALRQRGSKAPPRDFNRLVSAAARGTLDILDVLYGGSSPLL